MKKKLREEIWGFRDNEEDISTIVIGTRDEAIQEALDSGINSFLLGKYAESKLEIDAHDIIEKFQDELYDFIDWSPPRDDINLLQIMLQKTYDEWSEKTKNKALFYELISEEVRIKMNQT
jgi:hypothetical protein